VNKAGGAKSVKHESPGGRRGMGGVERKVKGCGEGGGGGEVEKAVERARPSLRANLSKGKGWEGRELCSWYGRVVGLVGRETFLLLLAEKRGGGVGWGWGGSFFWRGKA